MKRLRRSFVALLLLLIPGLLQAQQHQPKIIDVHMHYTDKSGFLDQLISKLDSVDGLAFVLTPPEGLERVRAAMKQHPDRIVGFGSIKLDDPDVLQQVDRFHAAGFRGLGEISSTRKNYDDRSYWPVFERAQKYHMIVLFHTGIVARGNPNKAQDVSFDRMRITRLDLIARQFPHLNLIGAHMGNPDYAEAAEVARWSPNIHVDLSGSSLIKKSNDYTFFKSIFWWSGVVSPHTPSSGTSAFEKLIFGSDVFGGELEEFDRALDRYHKMLDACDVPQAAQAMIFSGTMWRILNSSQQ